MRLVLDACIAIASEKPLEPSHAASRARINRVLTGADELVVPILFSVEVLAGLTRGGVPPERAANFVDRLMANAHAVTIGPVAARKIGRVAMQTRLRAADGAYAWLAGREGVPLVTADEEVLERAQTVCAVERP